MKFEIDEGETKTSPSWKSSAGLVAFLSQGSGRWFVAGFYHVSEMGGAQVN